MFSDIRKMYIFTFLRNFFLIGAVTVPFFMEWGKLSYTQLFFLQSWFSFWLFVLEIPTGTIADRFGRKVSIALGALSIAICFLIYSTTPNFIIFLIAEFIAALGGALISGADKALIYDKLRRLKRSKDAKHIFSNYSIASTLGIIVALPIGSLIASMMILPYPNNFSLVMAISAVPLFIAFLIALTIKEPKTRTPPENYFMIAKKGLQYFIAHKTLRVLALDLTLTSAVTFFIFWLYQPLLRNAGIDIKYFGFVGSAFNIFEIILLRNLRFFEKTFSNKRIIFFTALIPSVMYIILGISTNIMLITLAFFLIVGLRELRRPIFEHYINKITPSKQRATILSSVSMLERFIIAVMYPFLGLLLDWSFNKAIIILGVVSLFLVFTSKVTEDMLID